MTSTHKRSAAAWRGEDLGTRTVAYDERDAILYALAVGARATELDLVFEDRLRVLPTFALTLAQWAPDELGSRGAFDTKTALHGSQNLTVRAPLPRRGDITLSASVGEVWDKGSAAVFEVRVESDFFVATWSLFAPGAGGFGGERGPSKPARPEGEPTVEAVVNTADNQAALYRLTGDRHHIHLDPAAAAGSASPGRSCTGCAHWRRAPSNWRANSAYTPRIWWKWRAGSPPRCSLATHRFCGRGVTRLPRRSSSSTAGTR